MIYLCKQCSKEISLFEMDFTGESFCECGGQEMIFLRTGKGHEPAKKDTLSMIIQGVEDHFKAA